MAAMHAVEVADRDDRAVERRNGFAVATDDKIGDLRPARTLR
jgi:hypothetical protein